MIVVTAVRGDEGPRWRRPAEMARASVATTEARSRRQRTRSLVERGASHMNDAFRKGYFARRGLLSFMELQRRFNHAA